MHQSIQLRAKQNPYLKDINLSLSLIFYLFIYHISEEWTDLNEGASGRGQSIANLQLLGLAQIQHLRLKGAGVRLQCARWNSQGVESRGLCQNKNTNQTPTQLLRKPDCPTLVPAPMFMFSYLRQTLKNQSDADARQPQRPASRHKGGGAKDRRRGEISYSAPSSPTQHITHRRVTLLVGKISGEPWLKRPACILR